MTVQRAIGILRINPADQAAWEALYVGLRPLVLAYVGSLVHAFRVEEDVTPQDVFQDVMLALFERWPAIRKSVRTETDLAAYVRKSCRNLLVDRYRRDRRAEQLVDFLALRFSTAFPSQSELYRAMLLRDVIEKLPPECASLMRTYVEKDLSLPEIAELDGASPAALYSRWYRCIHKAQQLLAAKER